MSFRQILPSCLLAILVGCSSTDQGTDTSSSDGTGPGTTSSGQHDGGAGSSGGGSGGSSSGSGSSGGSSGSSSGSGSSGGSGSGSSGGGGSSSGSGSGSSSGGGSGSSSGGGTSGRSKCGGPLDAAAPTAASIVKDGPLTVTSYSSGLPTSSAYKSLTVYYPSNGAGPYVVVMISPGLTEVLLHLQGWARRFASYGYVAAFVEANDTGADSEAMRADGLWAAIGSMKGENTRQGGPLVGKLADCIVTSGHSLGGGASISVANDHPGDVKGALGFNPYDGSTTFSKIVAPTLIVTGQSDTTAAPAQHGRRQYDSMSSSLTKEYVEITGGNHQAALSPSTIPGQYAIAWIKLTVDGDTRYRPFLDKASSGLSDFASTLP
jgi:dienelactone hydrolase